MSAPSNYVAEKERPCPKCGQKMVVVGITRVHDQALKHVDRIVYELVGKDIGALVRWACRTCGHSITSEENYVKPEWSKDR